MQQQNNGLAQKEVKRNLRHLQNDDALPQPTSIQIQTHQATIQVSLFKDRSYFCKATIVVTPGQIGGFSTGLSQARLHSHDAPASLQLAAKRRLGFLQTPKEKTDQTRQTT